jgi:hypothetical protein
MGFVLMVRGFVSLDARRGSLERDLDLVILGVWWSEFDWQLFTFLGAIEAMRFVWVAMVTDGWGRLSNGDYELLCRGIFHHDGGSGFLLMVGILISSIEDGDSGCFSFMTLSSSLCLLLFAFLLG